MTRYHVHIFREMRVTFRGVEAESAEHAAEIARGRQADQADAVEDCEGIELAALVDVEGDEGYEHSQWFHYTVEPTASKEAL